MFILERDRQNASGLGAEREGDTETEAGSRLWAVSTEPDTGLKFTSCETMTWAEVGHSTNWVTQAPLKMINFKVKKELFEMCEIFTFSASQLPPLVLFMEYYIFYTNCTPESILFWGTKTTVITLTFTRKIQWLKKCRFHFKQTTWGAPGWLSQLSIGLLTSA